MIPSRDEEAADRLSVSSLSSDGPKITSSVKESEDEDEEDDSKRILVPDVDEDESIYKINLKSLWIFLGPGFLMSIAYLDPGNIESDLQSGNVAGYRLLWVLLTAHILGLLLQRLSARLGVVSGKHMAQVAYFYYPKIPRLTLWIMIELAIVGSDMQEVIGTSIALFLLSDARIPIWAGVIITVIDTLTFLFMDRYGYRKLEAFFCFLIAVMAFSFGYEYVIAKPNQLEVLKGVFIPTCGDCDAKTLLQAVGCIGAVIMPHNLYLHSALVQSRNINRTKKRSIEQANKYFFIESGLALLCSFVINLFVMSVFGTGLYHHVENVNVYNQCVANNVPHSDIFLDQNNTLNVDIYSGGVYLGCRFGLAAMYIWAVGILAAGQSSTMAGCYAGQFVMEGFVQMKWTRLRRVLLTRSIAIVPTLLVAVLSDLKDLSRMNDALNALMMIQLPFALIPLLTFASSRSIMRSFRTSLFFRLFFAVLSCVLIVINIYFIQTLISSFFAKTWILYASLAVFFSLYFTFIFYLIIYCLVSVGFDSLTNSEFMQKIFPRSSNLGVDAPWIHYNEIDGKN